ncbi:restriction endonuclease subunit R [Arthrobacter sp. W1]|nr:restriction endonuclease subunit R [Arthrobacter sp. W1]
MSNPKISTFREVTPFVYSWTTPDIPKYFGWEKIGYTEQAGGPDARIAQQASQLSVRKEKLWALRAFFQTERGGRFTDKDFHAYLKRQGIEREYNPNSTPKRTEWHRFDNAVRSSKEYFLQFASQDEVDIQRVGTDDYRLRPEQQMAVAQAIDAFELGYSEVLWNAKPRFGKTLTAYDLMRRLEARKVLIVTNRPAIANSWFDDFAQFIGHQTSYVFVSESASLAGRETMTRDEWTKYSTKHQDEDPRIVEFLSLQDLKGSQYFGGQYEKLEHIADFDWDLLVIDEAHEGIDTIKTDIAFDKIKRKATLHLSGTPFKALASGKFDQKQIYNWTYEDEQTARAEWSDESQDNPYSSLPTLNMFTYQISRMITDRLAEGMALSEDEANIDYAFDLNEFFSTNGNGVFEHREDIVKFLDRLTDNEKYPFSTSELRNEIRHSFWLLDRVSSAKALQKLLEQHEVFKDYTIILAAGDGKGHDDVSTDASEKSLVRVRKAIADAEKTGGKTITLSVGQLTTGVTVPEWTAVLMLSNLSSPALYMQAAFRAQNPHTFMRGELVLQKKNAYIFDFAPERTLTIFDEFANNLRPNPSGSSEVRQDNIRRLLNFFPVIGEDSEGRMVELDAAQVLTIPRVFKAKEVVRRGFLSNLLFDNVAGIFRYSEHVKNILEKLPEAKGGKIKSGTTITLEEPVPVTDHEGNVKVDTETVINPKVAELGPPVWSRDDVPFINPATTTSNLAKELASFVTEKTQETREKLKEEYGLTDVQTNRDIKRTEAEVEAAVERALVEKRIGEKHLENELARATTDAEMIVVEEKQAANDAAFEAEVLSILKKSTEAVAPDTVTREETKKAQKRADQTMDDARSHLRGFARTIPLFLMAYGHENMRLANFDNHTPDDVFMEITGISEAEFRVLRDGQEVVEADGQTVQIPGFFDEAVFDQAIQEFLAKKAELADYIDSSLTENIFAYIPQQESSRVFTPQYVVDQMVDLLEEKNPGIFEDPTKTFADLFSTAGLFLMELVRRLDSGLATKIPDQQQRLKHILTTQLFEMSHSRIFHDITLEAVSGGIEERKQWMEESGHFQVGNLATMTSDERKALVNDMLQEGE